MLESLEQEYKREEDWCGGADKLGPNCETDHVSPMISKHLEQKEAFLKVCNYDVDIAVKSQGDFQGLPRPVCISVRRALWPGETPTSSSSTCTGTASTCPAC